LIGTAPTRISTVPCTPGGLLEGPPGIPGNPWMNGKCGGARNDMRAG
jgi:hypothetical protein